MGQIPNQHITSIPGIGLATGAAILAEIGDVQRFESAEKLVATRVLTPRFTRPVNSRLLSIT